MSPKADPGAILGLGFGFGSGFGLGLGLVLGRPFRAALTLELLYAKQI